MSLGAARTFLLGSTWSPGVLIEAVRVELKVPEQCDEHRTGGQADERHKSRVFILRERDRS